MYRDAAEYIRKKINITPNIGIILGSGLSNIADLIDNPVIIDYADIPNFPITTVRDHANRFILGKLSDKEVIVMQGRFHFYEGYEPSKIVLPIRTMKLLGVETLIVTNAAGGVNDKFKPGDIMIINDHINISGINPLRGKNDDELGPRFPDMSNAYDFKLREQMHKSAEKLDIDIHEGVYAMMPGPSYETPAEVRMLACIGADAVGMSTVPEVIAAAHCGMEVIGLSCITNMATGILDDPLSHEEVVATAKSAEQRLKDLLNDFIKSIEG